MASGSTAALARSEHPPTPVFGRWLCQWVLLSLFYASRYQRLAGVELSKSLAEAARCGTAKKWPLPMPTSETLAKTPDSSFDLILFHHVLEHIPREHTIQLLREFHRAAAPGGR